MNKKTKYILTILIAMNAAVLQGCDSIKNLFGGNDENQPPTIELQAEKLIMALGESQVIRATAADPDGDSLTIRWEASAGTIVADSGSSARFTAPLDTMVVEVRATAIDPKEAQVSATIPISIGNAPPLISSMAVSKTRLLPGNSLQIDVTANDPENLPLRYRFRVEPDSGQFFHNDPADAQARWTAPANSNPGREYPARYYQLIAEVSDPPGFTSRDTAQVLVYSEYESIWVVDSGKRTVEKYTSNGLPVLTASELFQKPVAVASNILDNYGCYVADFDAGSVVKIDAEGQTVTSYSNLPQAIDLAVYRIGRTIWVLSVGENTVTVIDGFQNTEIKKIYGFRQPQAITINQASGDVWIAEPANNRLIRLDAAAPVSSWPDTITTANSRIFPDSAGDFNTLLSPSVRNVSGATLYAADKNDSQIERMVWDGSRYQRGQPADIPPLQPRFVGATSIANLGDVVVTLSADGRWIAFPEADPADLHLLAGDYSFRVPNAFGIAPEGGYAWVGDNGTNQLVRVAFDDAYRFQSAVRISGFIFLEDVVINR